MPTTPENDGSTCYLNRVAPSVAALVDPVSPKTNAVTLQLAHLHAEILNPTLSDPVGDKGSWPEDFSNACQPTISAKSLSFATVLAEITCFLTGSIIHLQTYFVIGARERLIVSSDNLVSLFLLSSLC